MEASIVIIIFKNVGKIKISRIFLCLNIGSIILSCVTVEKSHFLVFRFLRLIVEVVIIHLMKLFKEI